jgi:hypothetical protein
MNDRAKEDPGPCRGTADSATPVELSSAPHWEGYDLEILNAVLDPHDVRTETTRISVPNAVLIGGAGDDLIVSAPGLVGGFATSASALGGSGAGQE